MIMLTMTWYNDDYADDLTMIMTWYTDDIVDDVDNYLIPTYQGKGNQLTYWLVDVTDKKPFIRRRQKLNSNTVDSPLLR